MAVVVVVVVVVVVSDSGGGGGGFGGFGAGFGEGAIVGRVDAGCVGGEAAVMIFFTMAKDAFVDVDGSCAFASFCGCCRCCCCHYLVGRVCRC